jgi:hypothetical protein
MIASLVTLQNWEEQKKTKKQKQTNKTCTVAMQWSMWHH